MQVKYWLPLLLCISILVGCSFPGAYFGLSGEDDKDSLGLTPEFSYEVKKQTPNILVNQIGYLPQGSKVAILQGLELESVYYVYNAETGQQVFQGILKEAAKSENDGEIGDVQKITAKTSLYMADFSQLEEEGSYYLFHNNLGYSDTFVIENQVYDSLENHILDQLAAENRDTSGLCYQLAGILFTLELYPDKIQEKDRLQTLLQEKIDFLALAQDSQSGSVYDEITGENGNQNISLTATAEFAGVMAMYANYLQGIDQVLANQYQLSAQKAYGSIQNSLDNVNYDAGYFAATHLFKLTGQYKYSQAIGQYLSIPEEQKRYTGHDFSVFGDYAYLSSKYGINMEWSKQIMNRVKEQAEKISLSSPREYYYISREREHYDVDGILKDMMIMALINYVITNYEYTTIQRNCLDYLLGRNPDALCLIEGFGARNSLDNHIERMSRDNLSLFYLLLQSTK